MTQQTTGKASRREELLAIAAELFAQRGFKNTTVRDIADAAGILSGSLYHHFDSKESMVDEILSFRPSSSGSTTGPAPTSTHARSSRR
jgi:AcrR family transcriptional regulator